MIRTFIKMRIIYSLAPMQGKILPIFLREIGKAAGIAFVDTKEQFAPEDEMGHPSVSTVSSKATV
jgi:hypothetical protein